MTATPAASADVGGDGPEAARQAARWSALEDAFALHGGDATAVAPSSQAPGLAAPTASPELPSDEPSRFEASARTEAPAAGDGAASAPPETPAEPITVGQAELALVADAVVQQLAPRTQALLGQPGPTEQLELLDGIALQLELTLRVAEALRLAPLEALVQHALRESVGQRAAAAPVTAAWGAALEGWTCALLDWLAQPDAAHAAALGQATTDGRWQQPGAAGQAAAIEQGLARVRVLAPATARVAHLERAAAADVLLEFGADVVPAVRDSLLRELPGRCEEFSQRVAALVATGLDADLEVACRIAHTLKGDGGTAGLRGIVNLAHALEDVLLALRGAGVPDPALGESLIRAADCLAAMGDCVLGVDAPPPDAVAVLQDLLDWIPRLGGGDDAIGASSQADAVPDTAPAWPLAAAAAEPAPPEAAPTAEVSAALRVEATQVVGLLHLASETGVHNRQIEDRALRLRGLDGAAQERNRQVAGLVEELQKQVEVRGLSMVAAATGPVDPLELERFNEMHVVTQRLVEAIADLRTAQDDRSAAMSETQELLRRQAAAQLALQEQLLTLRAQPFAAVVPRLQRVVRQAARSLDKACELEISGAETPLDAERLAQLVEPLAHLLRNAVDHGVEAADARRAAGKPAAGQLRLAASAHQGLFVLRLEDDGPGLDFEAIRRRGEELGLIAPDADADSEALTRLIFAPGFSTRPSASHVSGRGLGMDIVARRVADMHGTVAVQSRPGAGCRVELRVPVTHLLALVVVAEVGGAPVAILLHSVDHMVSTDAGHAPGARVEIDGEPCTLTRLGLPARATGRGRQQRLLLGHLLQGERHALAVDAVYDARPVVVESLGPWLPALAGVLGVTILGDGRVAPVVDLALAARAAPAQAPVLPTVQRSRALVVDDSLSARRALEELLTDAGIEVMTAGDGIEATAILREQRPDLLLVDLEMPRMNGLELTGLVRGDPELRSLPVIMITSRNSPRHRELARAAGVDELLTKPYSDVQLMDLIQQRLAAIAARA